MMKNRWLNGAIPAVMIHLSIGSVYAFSVLTKHIMANTGILDKSTVTWAFSIAIFFLGMSAAFLGNYVEKIWPRKSALISCLFFGAGLIGSGVAMMLHSLPMLFIFYGAIMGIGLGVGYITPIKTLIRWFYNNRGFATGIAVLGFGLAAFIAGPVMELLISGQVVVPLTDILVSIKSPLGLANMFFVLGVCYMAIMFVASRMIAPPPEGYEQAESWKKKAKSWKLKEESSKEKVEIVPLEQYSTAQAVRKISFYALWFMLFVNISSGISLLAVASPMLQEKFPLAMTAAAAAAVVSIMSLCNAAGRFVWSSFSDFVGRPVVYSGFLLLQVGLFLGLAFTQSHIVFLTLLFVILSCYGAGFACIPAYLSDMYGVKNVSAIHGRVLTAWACAGIVGPFFTTRAVKSNGGDYTNILIYISIALALASAVSIIAARAYMKRHGGLKMG